MRERGSPRATNPDGRSDPPSHCPTGFDEELLTGYLDGALPQGESQRVRLHLEDCEHCRRLYREMETVREATMSTRFLIPPDHQWKEVPRTSTSRVFRGGGWLLLLVWAAAAGTFALWQLATAPVGAIEKSLVFTGISGVGLLFVSILLDRLKSLKTDRYTRVEK